MNLIIDIGNTQAKLAVFQNEELHEVTTLEKDLSSEDITAFSAKFPSVDSAILCAVSDCDAALLSMLKGAYAFIEFSEHTPIPITNSYETPATLGKDRLAAAVGAHLLLPGKNVLVIDFGTCVTYDFVSSSNEYLGGAIAPGMEMRFKALHTFTGKLPLVAHKNQEDLIGKTTEESILSGVQHGMIAEVKGTIEAYSKQVDGLEVLITGGDLDFFNLAISGKNDIFADPFLVLKGLNAILNYNDNTQAG